MFEYVRVSFDTNHTVGLEETKHCQPLIMRRTVVTRVARVARVVYNTRAYDVQTVRVVSSRLQRSAHGYRRRRHHPGSIDRPGEALFRDPIRTSTTRYGEL